LDINGLEGEKLRLNRINAPEMHGPEKEAGKQSRSWLPENGDYTNINDELAESGLAVYKEY